MNPISGHLISRSANASVASDRSATLIEPLEGRVFMDAMPGPGRPPGQVPTAGALPLHVKMARDLVQHVIPQNNLYDTPSILQWAGVDGQTVYKNTSVCSTLITKLTMRAYGFTSSNFTQWTGETSPEAEDYYDAAITNNGFKRVMNIANLRVGDLFIAKYLDPEATVTGHVTMVNQLPRFVSMTSTTRTYSMEVIDSSSSYHGSADTRNVIDPGTGETDTGIGIGTMRMITDTNGLLIKYSWSMLTSSVIYDATERPSLFATIPQYYFYGQQPSRMLGTAPDSGTTTFNDSVKIGDGANVGTVDSLT
ncbi:MAG: hypothetical protein H7Z14_20570 [Anaerolineae bacterium]|nr:hypothetical protein [Phycisphaerae bacterium]